MRQKSEGFNSVLAAVAKLASKEQRFIKSADVQKESGLSRQLVHYHLTRMREDGLIGYIGNGVYTDIDLTRIATELENEVLAGEKNRPKATSIVGKKEVTLLNAKIDFFHAVHGLSDGVNTADLTELKREIIDDIDYTIAMLRSTRKYVSNLSDLSLKGRWRRLTYPRWGINDKWDETKVFDPAEWPAIASLYPHIEKLMGGKVENWKVLVDQIREQVVIKKDTRASTDDPGDGDQGNQE